MEIVFLKIMPIRASLFLASVTSLGELEKDTLLDGYSVSAYNLALAWVSAPTCLSTQVPCLVNNLLTGYRAVLFVTT